MDKRHILEDLVLIVQQALERTRVVYAHLVRQDLHQNPEVLAYFVLQGNSHILEVFVATVPPGTAALLVALHAPNVHLDRCRFLVGSASTAAEWARHGPIFSSNVLFVPLIPSLLVVTQPVRGALREPSLQKKAQAVGIVVELEAKCE